VQELLEERKKGYLEVGNTNRVRKIEEEIYKWEELLRRIDLANERTITHLINFIKSKDLWLSYLHWEE